MAKANEIQIIRIYDAPVKTVWDAWTDPEQTAKWWGPRGYTITTHSKELKPGGIWDYTMYGPEGKEWPTKTLYHEVEKHKKLVYDHGGNDERPPLFRVTVLFSEEGSKTKMDMTMALPTAEEAAQTRAFIKKASGDSTWDRLAEYLGGDKNLFVINRSFDALLDVMFDMWTKPEHMAQWAGPAGAQIHYTKTDIRPGGVCSYSMTGGPMGTMYGKANYITLDKPDLIIYTQQFTNEQGNVARHPMAPTWPETMLTTVRLIAEGPNRTRVNLTWEPYGNVTQEEIATFLQARAGMTMGWTGSFDKLEELLANPPANLREVS